MVVFRTVAKTFDQCILWCIASCLILDCDNNILYTHMVVSKAFVYMHLSLNQMFL